MKFHVYIARGPWAGGDDLEAPDKEAALDRGAELYKDTKREDLKAHPSIECNRRGCNG